MMNKSPDSPLNYSGYTLIELMLVLAIVSVVLLAAQRPLLEFHRIAFQEQQKIILQGDFQRFLLLLKSELIQAGYALSSGNETAVEISTYAVLLKADRNREATLRIPAKKSPIFMIRKQKCFSGNQEILPIKL